MYNYVEFFNNLNLYAIIDLALLLFVAVLAVLFFVHKRNIKLLLIFVVLIGITVTLDVYAELSSVEILTVARAILHGFIWFVIVAMVAVYQTDFRAIFQQISRSRKEDLYAQGYGSDDELRKATSEILTACQNMSKQRLGAIIVITPSTISQNVLESGVEVDAKVTAELLESIFFKNAPLHDGAVIIKGNKILNAGCFLPLTQRSNVNKEMGTRHRAAIGISEESDSISIVVSEETGIISIVKDGDIKRYIGMERLKEELEEVYNISAVAMLNKAAKKDKWPHLRRK